MFYSCGKNNLTGFEASDYSKQKLANLTVSYSNDEKGDIEEKTLDDSDLVVTKTTYSEEFQQRYVTNYKKIIDEAKKEINGNQAIFNNTIKKTPPILNLEKLSTSSLSPKGVTLSFEQRISYQSDLAFCDELETIENNKDTFNTEGDDILVMHHEQKTFHEIKNTADGNNSFSLKRSRNICLKIPYMSFNFSLKENSSLVSEKTKNENLSYLKDLLKNSNWDHYQEKIIPWHLKYLGKTIENAQQTAYYTYTLYHYLPVDLKIDQQFTFNWQTTPITIDTRELSALTKESKLPLELKSANILIPSSKVQVTKQHFAKKVHIPNEPCIAFIQTPLGSRGCEKRPQQYEDQGYDLFTYTDTIEYISSAVDIEQESALLADIFAYDSQLEFYYPNGKSSLKGNETVKVMRTQRTEKKHFNGNLEVVQQSSQEESMNVIYQFHFVRQFDDWKKTTEDAVFSTTKK